MRFLHPGCARTVTHQIERHIVIPLSLALLLWYSYEAIAQTSLSAQASSGNDSLFFTAKAGVVRTDFSDQDILAATYSDYRVPRGFYDDPAPDSVDGWYANVREILKPSYSFYGRKVPREAFDNRALDSLAAWYDTWLGPWRKSAPAVEFCTDSPDEARRWVRMIDASRSVHRKLRQEHETNKYFEFRMEGPSPRHYRALLRIHKCSYINRWKVDPWAHYWGRDDFSGWFQGVFNVRPVTRENVHELGEYLWISQRRRALGEKVMSSYTRDRGKEIVHTMYIISKSLVDQDWMVPRHQAKRRELANVTLVRLDYNVNKKSGEIFLDSKVIRTIKVRDNPPEVLLK